MDKFDLLLSILTLDSLRYLVSLIALLLSLSILLQLVNSYLIKLTCISL